MKNIFPWRRKVMFRVDPERPEPEELKRRFRKRLLKSAFIVAITLLGIPVFRDRLPAMASARLVREFAEWLGDSQTLAASFRAPVMIRFDAQSGTWQRWFFASTASDCRSPETSAIYPAEYFSPEENQPAIWTASWLGKNIQTLCYHPQTGWSIESTALVAQPILISASPQEDGALGRSDRIRWIALSGEGQIALLGNR